MYSMSRHDSMRGPRAPPLLSSISRTQPRADKERIRAFLCGGAELHDGRYESGDFSEPAGLEGPSQYEAFTRITDLFVRPGSREEVNIRCVQCTI